MRSLVVGETLVFSTHHEDEVFYQNRDTFISLAWVADDGRLYERWVDGKSVGYVVLPTP
jgi:hypothetical protein